MSSLTQSEQGLDFAFSPYGDCDDIFEFLDYDTVCVCYA
jgi:hypothetical protein